MLRVLEHRFFEGFDLSGASKRDSVGLKGSSQFRFGVFGVTFVLKALLTLHGGMHIKATAAWLVVER